MGRQSFHSDERQEGGVGRMLVAAVGGWGRGDSAPKAQGSGELKERGIGR